MWRAGTSRPIMPPPPVPAAPVSGLWQAELMDFNSSSVSSMTASTIAGSSNDRDRHATVVPEPMEHRSLRRRQTVPQSLPPRVGCCCCRWLSSSGVEG